MRCCSPVVLLASVALLAVACTTKKDGKGTILDDSGSTTTVTTTGGFRSTDVEIDGAPGSGSDRVQMCALSGGELVVAWADEREGARAIWATVSADGGMTWPEAPLKVSTSSAPADNPSLACGATVAYLAWEDERDSEIESPTVYFAKSDASAAGWKPDVRLVGSDDNIYNRSEPKVAVQGNDVHVVWVSDENGAPDIFASSSVDQGSSFSSPMRIDGGADGSAWSNHPVVYTGAGKVLVAWEDRRNGSNDIYVATSGDSGASFGSDTKVSAGTGDSYDPVIAADGGEAYVVWHEQGAEPNLEVYAAYSSSAGDSWAAPFRLSEGVLGERPSVLPQAVLAAGTLHTVWFQGMGGGYHAVYKQVSAGAELGSQLRLDHAPDAAQVTYPVLEVAGANVVVGWRDSRNAGNFDNTDLYYAFSTDGGQTWSPTDLRIDSHPNGSTTTEDLRLSLDSTAISAAWSDARNGNSDVFFIHLTLGDASD